MTDEYWRAFDRCETIGGMKGIHATRRFNRVEAHERR